MTASKTNTPFQDKFGVDIEIGNLLESDYGRVYEVIKDKNFGISIKDVQNRVIEKMCDEMCHVLEIIYLDDTFVPVGGKAQNVC